MHHQAQKGFHGIFIGLPDNQEGYLVYVPATRQIVTSMDVIFDETFTSALAYTSHPYHEAMVTCPSVSFIPFATSSHEQTGDVIMFAQFEEGNRCNEDTETSKETLTFSDIEAREETDSEMPSLIDPIDTSDSKSDDEDDDASISSSTLRDITSGSQMHPKVNI